jgi:predicted phage-related endonuclease
MIRGTELEPIARKRVSESVGVEFLECGWLQCEEIPLLGISPDGISPCNTMALEVKCTGNKNHVKAIRANEIPLEYLSQCLHYFTVNPKLEKLYFAMFRPENQKKQLFIKVVTRETEINLGTQAKPLFDTVQNWVVKSKELAKELAIQLDNELINFGF